MRKTMQLRLGISVCLLLAASAPSFGQQTVYVRDSEKPLKGAIKEESAQGILLSGVKERIPAADIIDVEYDLQPLTARLELYRPARKAESDAADPGLSAKRSANLALAIDKYQQTLKALSAGQAAAVRHLEFKIAALTAEQAQSETFPLEPGITKLKEFKTKYPRSWQLTRDLKLLGDLYLQQKQYAEAEATFKELAAADVTPATRNEAGLWAAQVSLRAGKYADAQAKLDALIKKLPKDDPYAIRARIAQAECLSASKKGEEARKLLQQVLNEAKDRVVKAAAYNALGESYFQSKMLKEARWEFLYVDVLYNQDKSEHAKALYYLWAIFGQLNEPERAEDCRATLINDRQFQGSEYQRLAREKRAPQTGS